MNRLPQTACTFAFSALLQLASVGAQECSGPTHGMPSIGGPTNPPAVSGAIREAYGGSFSVPRTGIYELQGHVSLGRGSGAPVEFTSVVARVNGQTVLTETPPFQWTNPMPNDWTYHWSIYTDTITKPWSLRMLLEKDRVYDLDLEATGSYQVYTIYHRRNYSVALASSATYCGPAASVESIGSACGGAAAPHLEAFAPPTLGTVRDVMLRGGPNLPAVVLLGAPTLQPTYIGAGCQVYVDLGLPLRTLPASTDGTGTGFAVFAVPADSNLVGLVRVAQGVLLDPAAPLGFSLSNGVELLVGF